MRNISLNRKMKLGGGGVIALEPCLDNPTYWLDKFSVDGLFLDDKSGLGNDAALTEGNCIGLNGTDQYYNLTPYVNAIKGKSTGFLNVVFNSSKAAVPAMSLFSITDYDGINYYAFLQVGASLSAYADESLNYTFKENGVLLFEMVLRNGNTFLLNGADRKIEMIIDGINNRFIVDGITYDEAGGQITFTAGSKTSQYFTNITGANRGSLGCRTFNYGTQVPFDQPLQGLLSDFNIDDSLILNAATKGSLIDSISGDSVNVEGTDFDTINTTINTSVSNANKGFSKGKLKAGVVEYTEYQHLYTDEIIYSGVLFNNNILDTILFDSVTGAKGYKIRVENLILKVDYYNTTSETFVTNADIELNKGIAFSVTINNGLIDINLGSNIYQFNTTLGAFADNSGYIKLNGEYTSVYEKLITINSEAKKCLLKIPAKFGNDYLDCYDESLTNPQGVVIQSTPLNIVYAGQSNCVGRTLMTLGTDKKYHFQFDDVEILNGTFEPFKLGITQGSSQAAYDDRFGSEVSMIHKLKEKYGTINLLKYGFDGTSLYVNWNSDTGALYTSLRIYSNIMLTEKGAPDILIWNQWESDAPTELWANSYYDLFKSTFTDYRSIYNSGLKIIACEPSSLEAAYAYKSIIVDAFNQLLAEGFIQGIIPTDDLTFLDGTHYDQESIDIIGERAAEIIETLIPPSISIKNKGEVFNDPENKLTLPTYGALSFDEIRNNTDAGSKLWYTPIYDGVELVGMLNIITYSITPPYPCINDTINYTKSAVTFNGEKVKYNGELVTSFKTI